MDLIQIEPAGKAPVRKPEWLKARAPMGENYHELKRLARSRYLNYQSMIKQWLSERMEQEMRDQKMGSRSANG